MANINGQPRKEETTTLSIRIRARLKRQLLRKYPKGTLNKQFKDFAENLNRVNEKDGN